MTDAGDIPVCSCPGCGFPGRLRRGMCQRHYDRWRQTGVRCSPPERERARKDPVPCDYCVLPVTARGMCSSHYGRWRKTGVLGGIFRKKAAPGLGMSGPGHIAGGYRLFCVGGRHVREHRAVMEEMIGRTLYADETVHHKNGSRADNRPENLELWSSYQPAGQRAADKVTWALEILERYAPERLSDVA